MKKKIGFIGSGPMKLGHQAILSAQLAVVREVDQEVIAKRKREEAHKEMLQRFVGQDGSKCTKGHSYQNKYGPSKAGGYKKRWVCQNCGREL